MAHWQTFFKQLYRQPGQIQDQNQQERPVDPAKEKTPRTNPLQRPPAGNEKGFMFERRQHLQHVAPRRLDVSIDNILGMLKLALQLHTVAVYWLTDDKSRFHLFDAVTPNLDLIRKNINAGEGVLGAVLLEKGTVHITRQIQSNRILPYYTCKMPIHNSLGAPLMEPGTSDPIGVILADRTTETPFSSRDADMLQMAAAEIVRIWHTEWELKRWEQIRNEATGLYDATQELIESLHLQDVADKVAGSFQKIYTGIDFSAVLLLNPKDKNLTIKAVSANDAYADWRKNHLGRAISLDGHLCGLAIKKNLIVPEKDFDKRPPRQRRIFGAKLDPPGLKSLKVVPLKHTSTEATNMGVLVLASRTQAYFPEGGEIAEDLKRTLETISNIAAISIQNANRYETLETLATLDPLTGLYNRRRFLEILEHEFAEARRYRSPLSLILADIDHFKKVNDTYGHPMGDHVLKWVADLFKKEARTTDQLCRYGGEEFAIIMPHTNQIGGVHLAERFRKQIRDYSFQCGQNDFSVTLSFGVCTLHDFEWPMQDLINCADKALYQAKQNGRDQVVPYRPTGRSKTPHPAIPQPPLHKLPQPQ